MANHQHVVAERAFAGGPWNHPAGLGVQNLRRCPDQETAQPGYAGLGTVVCSSANRPAHAGIQRLVLVGRLRLQDGPDQAGPSPQQLARRWPAGAPPTIKTWKCLRWKQFSISHPELAFSSNAGPGAPCPPLAHLLMRLCHKRVRAQPLAQHGEDQTAQSECLPLENC